MYEDDDLPPLAIVDAVDLKSEKNEGKKESGLARPLACARGPTRNCVGRDPPRLYSVVLPSNAICKPVKAQLEAF